MALTRKQYIDKLESDLIVKSAPIDRENYVEKLYRRPQS